MTAPSSPESVPETRADDEIPRGGLPGWIVVLPLVVLAVTFLALSRPSFFEAEFHKNTQAAALTLREVASAQAAFAREAMLDTDGDGRGEFADLGALLSAASAGSLLELSGSRKEVEGTTVAELRGYFFAVHPGVPGEGDPADAAETRWLAYAWPVEHGVSGTRCLVISQRGEVFGAPESESRYSGLAGMPAADAALADGELTGEHPATDGLVWEALP